MASIMKATKKACGNLFNHYERKEGIRFGNQDIDKTKSYLNYNLAPNNNLTQMEILNKRLSEVKVLKRDDVNVTCNWVITLPNGIDKNTEDEKEFFKETYNFLKNEYGEKNIISAYVHKDEITPHIHFCFVPVVIDKKKNIEKVSAYELINKSHLKEFHKKLDSHINFHFQKLYMEKGMKLNKRIEILNGTTANGNKTVLELKNKRLEHINQKLENKNKLLEKNIKVMNDEIINLDKDIKKRMELVENIIQTTLNIDKNEITRRELIEKYNNTLEHLEEIQKSLKLRLKCLLTNDKSKLENNLIDLKKEIEKNNKIKKSLKEQLEDAKQKLESQNKTNITNTKKDKSLKI